MLTRALTFAHRVATDYDSGHFWLLCTCLLVGDAILTSAIVVRVPYTEIDWEAYMSEVGTVLAGDFNYTHAKGATGPLVYPAGFVAVYAALHGLTGGGADIRLAQWVFAVLYLATLGLALDVYRKTRLAPPWALALLCASKRQHSIYVLRLFNDGVAAVLVWWSLSRFARGRWRQGSAIFSLAVSVKMSAILHAPGLFVMLWKQGGLPFAAANIALCAAIQLALGAPFLLTDARAYVGGAFDLGRVFMHKWTVNLQFLDPETFVSKGLALGLIVATAACDLALAHTRWCRAVGGFPSLLARAWRAGVGAPHTPHAREVVAVLLSANFVGICFSRTLHYQFYSWYFHSLPFLLWALPVPTAARLCLFVAIEVVWNVYPPSPAAALTLNVCHAILLVGLFATDATRPTTPAKRAVD